MQDWRAPTMNDVTKKQIKDDKICSKNTDEPLDECRRMQTSVDKLLHQRKRV